MEDGPIRERAATRTLTVIVPEAPGARSPIIQVSSVPGSGAGVAETNSTLGSCVSFITTPVAGISPVFA